MHGNYHKEKEKIDLLTAFIVNLPGSCEYLIERLLNYLDIVINEPDLFLRFWAFDNCYKCQVSDAVRQDPRTQMS